MNSTIYTQAQGQTDLGTFYINFHGYARYKKKISAGRLHNMYISSVQVSQNQSTFLCFFAFKYSYTLFKLIQNRFKLVRKNTDTRAYSCNLIQKQKQTFCFILNYTNRQQNGHLVDSFAVDVSQTIHDSQFSCNNSGPVVLTVKSQRKSHLQVKQMLSKRVLKDHTQQLKELSPHYYTQSLPLHNLVQTRDMQI